MQWKKSFCSSILLCSPWISWMVSCQGLQLEETITQKSFWGWASRDCRFCVGADGPGGFSFAIRKFTSSSKYSLLGYCSAQQLEALSLPAHPHEQDRARTPSSFPPPADLFVLSLPRRPDPQSSHLPISAAHSYQELVASSSSLLCSLSGLSRRGRGRAHVLLFGKPRSKQEQQRFYFTSGLVFGWTPR